MSSDTSVTNHRVTARSKSQLRLPVELIRNILENLDPVSLTNCLRSCWTIRRSDTKLIERVMRVSLSVPSASALKSLIEKAKEGSRVKPSCLIFDSADYCQAQFRLDPEVWPEVEHVTICGNVGRDLDNHRFGRLVTQLENLKHLTLHGVGDPATSPDAGTYSHVHFLHPGFFGKVSKLRTLELQYSGFDTGSRVMPSATTWSERGIQLQIVADLTKLKLSTRADNFVEADCNDLLDTLLNPLMDEAYNRLTVRFPESEGKFWETALRFCIDFYRAGGKSEKLVSRVAERTTMFPQLSLSGLWDSTVDIR